MSESRHELAFALQIRALQLPSPEREYRFHPSEMWRFDFAWPAFRVAVEIDGGIHTQGRHVRGAGFTADCHKLNCAALLDWTVIRLTPDMVRNGEGIAYLEQGLALRAAHVQ